MKRPMRVLVVEDSPFDQKVIVDYLSKQGIEVELESHAFGAISRIAGEFDRLDFVVIDYELPQYQGHVIESILRKVGLKAMYYTASAPSEIADKVTFPVCQKEYGVANLLRQIKSICQDRREALAL